jgi:hypothetical protein
MKRNRLAVAALAAWLVAAGSPGAQPAPQSGLAVETVHSQAYRLDIETVVSRGGWYLIGPSPEGYRIGDGVTPGMAGESAAYIRACTANALSGGGALERNLPAGAFAGKRIRLLARLKKEGGGAFRFYLQTLAREARFLRGRGQAMQSASSDWQAVEFVTDVPESAASLEVGLIFWATGAGATVWIDSMSIEVVDRDVSTKGELITSVRQRNPEDIIRSCDGVRY